MGTEITENDTVVTQVSFGGFHNHVSAKDLMEYLEGKIGQVWRCRLKKSWTPPDSYPNFEISDAAAIHETDEYKRVVPHAFVHFASPEAASWAKNAAGRCQLFMNDMPLKVSLGPETPFRLNQRTRTEIPCKLSDVSVEIGTLVRPDEFLVAWRGPSSGVDFIVDTFDNSCKLCFTRDTAFSIKDTNKHAIIRCDYKLEFLVRDINVIKQYIDFSSFSRVVLLQLASAPWIWYRTADDDIEVSAPFDLLDDDDPWIRTTDFTPGGIYIFLFYLNVIFKFSCSTHLFYSLTYGECWKFIFTFMQQTFALFYCSHCHGGLIPGLNIR